MKMLLLAVFISDGSCCLTRAPLVERSRRICLLRRSIRWAGLVARTDAEKHALDPNGIARNGYRTAIANCGIPEP